MRPASKRIFRVTARCLLLILGCILPELSRAENETPTPGPFPTQAKPIDGILVPVPKEIFRTLDEFHNINWRGVQRPEVVRWKSRGDPVQIALLLGAVVSEGFVAMEAEDASEVRDVGIKVLALARGLGVEHTVLRRSKSIMDCTDKGEWAAARKEWDGVLADLEERMIAIESEPLLQLVSLSGWLRGTEALCALVLQEYTTEHALVLRQAAMLDYLEKQLGSMSGKRKNHSMVVKMREGLRKIRSLVESDEGTLTQQTVREIGRVCHDLVAIPSHRAG
jgi:hypothetical protein